MHEASLYEDNCFLTLTYDDEHLPRDRSIDVREMQLFMKRLRKKYPQKIRFFACGEYGETTMRPHYHAILFNHDFEDKTHWKTVNENRLFRSLELQSLWPLGYSSLGTVTFQSAAYVARYVVKKVTGTPAPNHYQWIDPDTGEIHQRKPEFATMSRRPGLGKIWYENWKGDAYPDDFIIVNGVKMRPPKFYDSQLEKEDEQTLNDMKRQRRRHAARNAADNTPARLKVREKVQKARLNLLPRNVE